MAHKIIITLAILGILAAGFAFWKLHKAADAPSATVSEGLCNERSFEGVAYLVCTVDPAKFKIALRLKDAGGKPYQKLDRLAAAEPFLFAMNAGMYHEDFTPVGLYVEDGVERAPLNTADAPGNFFMKPNGVFFIDRAGKAGVLATEAFEALKPAVLSATQSGPMLVIDGNMHPRFEPDGQSKYVRNGVGVDKTGRAVFAISREPVSLGKFARLFLDALECPNALFFDGAVSALHDGKTYLVGGGYPAGPIVMVRRR